MAPSGRLLPPDRGKARDALARARGTTSGPATDVHGRGDEAFQLRGYNEAVSAHRLAEERSLALHRAVADKLASDPEALERARARVRRWLESSEVSPHWAHAWDEVLSRPLPEIRAFLVDESEEARALRQVTPFAGAIDPRTRWRIWREVREAMERAR